MSQRLSVFKLRFFQDDSQNTLKETDHYFFEGELGNFKCREFFPSLVSCQRLILFWVGNYLCKNCLTSKLGPG